MDKMNYMLAMEQKNQYYIVQNFNLNYHLPLLFRLWLASCLLPGNLNQFPPLRRMTINQEHLWQWAELCLECNQLEHLRCFPIQSENHFHRFASSNCSISEAWTEAPVSRA